MFSLFKRNHKKAALTFLAQHQIGQRIFSTGDGGPKMRYLRESGHIMSDRVSETRWVHTILSKPQS